MSELSRRYAIIEAPSILGLKPTGVDRLPEQLLDYGLIERIRARHAGRVPTPEYGFERDPQTLTLNAQAIADWSPKLADAVEGVLVQSISPQCASLAWSARQPQRSST